MQGAVKALQGHCTHIFGHCILHHSISHPYFGTLNALHGHCIHIQGNCSGHCNHCRFTASTFMGTASSYTTYCKHPVGHCIHCMGTASTFRDNAGLTATTAVTLHPDEVALQGHSNDCRITASSFMGTECYFSTYCINLGSNCIHCMGTASTFRERQGALQPLKLQFIQQKWQCRLTAIIEVSVHPLHWHCIHIPGQCLGHCTHRRDTASS